MANSKIDLVSAMMAIRNQITEAETRHKKEIDALQNALGAISSINTTCPVCAGMGTISVRICGDESLYKPCKSCDGSGIATAVSDTLCQGGTTDSEVLKIIADIDRATAVAGFKPVGGGDDVLLIRNATTDKTYRITVLEEVN